MLWNLPADMKRFKEITDGHTVIMGRKTKVNDENVEIVHSLLQIQEYIESKEESFVIGGATIYNFLMPYVKKMYVTQINKDFEGDSFFPKIDENKWKEIPNFHNDFNE